MGMMGMEVTRMEVTGIGLAGVRVTRMGVTGMEGMGMGWQG